MGIARSRRVATSSTSDILRRRLAAQRLPAATFARPAEVVAWLGAVQAQDYLGALWAVGLRLADARERDVEQALAEGTIVRSWPMRGTLHFLAAADARWMIELLAPRAAAAAAGRLRAMGIDEEVLVRARRALVPHLEGGRRLTRPAAYGVLGGRRDRDDRAARAARALARRRSPRTLGRPRRAEPGCGAQMPQASGPWQVEWLKSNMSQWAAPQPALLVHSSAQNSLPLLSATQHDSPVHKTFAPTQPWYA